MTIGDVLAVIAGIIGAAVSAWALLLCSTLALHHVARQGKSLFEERPFAVLITGTILSMTVGFLALLLVNQPNGLLKLIGIALSIGLLAVTVVGAGSLTVFIGERIRHADPQISSFTSHARGAGLLVTAGLAPVIGWFFVLPLTLLLSFGLGFRSLLALRANPSPTELYPSPSQEIEAV
jgi:hypothetical protein